MAWDMSEKVPLIKAENSQDIAVRGEFDRGFMQRKIPWEAMTVATVASRNIGQNSLFGIMRKNSC